MKTRILSAFGSSTLGIIAGLITNLWLLREVTHVVSSADFGVYAFVFQVTSYLAVLQLGLDFAGARTIAESLGKNEPSSANSAYWEVVRFNRYSALLCALFVGLIAGALWHGIGLASVPVGQLAASIALLAGATQVLNFIFRPYSSALIGSGCLATVNIIAIGSSIATTLVAFILLKMGWGILCIPASALAVTCLSSIVLILQTCSNCSWRTRQRSSPNPAMMKSILGFGWLTSLGGVAWTIEGTVDVMILGAYLGPSVVAIYALWWRFPSMIFSLCASLVYSAFPSFAERHGQSSIVAGKLLSKVSYLAIGLATLSLVGISLWLPSFVYLWVGQSYAIEYGGLVALGMGLLVTLRCYGNLLGMFLLASGNAQLTTKLSWIQAAVKVTLAIILIKPLGLIGVITASCIASMVQVSVLSVSVYKQGFFDIRTALHALGLTLIAVCVGVVGYRQSFQLPLASFVISVVLTSILWAVIWFGFAWYSDLRVYLVSLIPHKPMPFKELSSESD